MATSDTHTEVVRDPDARLMLRAKEGDEEAFAELVANYQGRLVNVFQHLMQSQESAEDLAQEVFLRVYRARRGYVPTAKFSTWLFKIANNVANTLHRTNGRRREVALNVKDSGPMGTRPEEQILQESRP